MAAYGSLMLSVDLCSVYTGSILLQLAGSERASNDNILCVCVLGMHNSWPGLISISVKDYFSGLCYFLNRQYKFT